MALYIRLLLALLVSSLQSSCASLADPSLPSTLPEAQVHTAAAETIMASLTIAVTQATLSRAGDDRGTPQASATPERVSTLTPTNTLTPTALIGPTGTTMATETPPTSVATPDGAQEIPPGDLQILNPGPASRVRSPFMLRAYLAPGHRGMVRIRLLGEDGRVLLRTIRTYTTRPGLKVYVNEPINFEISSVAEAARLEVSIDDEKGHLIALASLDLILLSIGEPELNPAGDLLETIVIQEPPGNAEVSGGIIKISGLARPRSDQPLSVELKTSEGEILATRLVAIGPPQLGGYGTFSIDVPYSLSSQREARISLIENGAHIPGIAHLSSLEVILNP